MAVYNSLREQGVNENYVETIKNIYENGTAIIRLHKDTNEIKIAKGVRQGDTISPKLFTASLESIFRKTDWEGKGIRIDGEDLNHLRFADDIVITTGTPEELQTMLTDLDRESKKVDLKIDRKKTKVMFNENVPQKVIEIEGEVIEAVDEYIYLGQAIKLEKDHDNEINRRIALGWKAFGMNRDILKNNMTMCLKRRI